jgi:hypothetical protein
MLDIVQNQLRENNPPETGLTLKRLLKEGYSRKRALEMIACCIATEVYGILKNKQPYVEDGYLAALRNLPRMPWETNDSA